MADTPKHSVSVAGIVVDSKSRVLVVQRRDNGHWEPPGGVLELNETPQRGVKREVYEETGVKVDVVRFSGVYKNMTLGVVSLVFVCVPTDGSATPTLESRRVEWQTLDQVDSNMEQAYSVRVRDAIYRETAVRVHDGVRLLEQAEDRTSIDRVASEPPGHANE